MSAQLRNHTEVDTTDGPVAGIAVRLVSRAPLQLHCGLVYGFTGESRLRIVHLAFHEDLRSGPAGRDYGWIRLNIDPVRVPSLIALLERIERRAKSQKIPYGMLFDGALFLEDGQLQLGDHGVGLTCATFVLALLRSAGIELVDIKTWPARTEDGIWLRHIVAALRSRGVDEDHVKRVEGETECVRFRPEEVTAAGEIFPPTVSFDRAQLAGQAILNALLRRKA